MEPKIITYSEAIKIRDHMSSFIKVLEQLPCASKPEQFLEAAKLWRATVPDSPILHIIEKM